MFEVIIIPKVSIWKARSDKHISLRMMEDLTGISRSQINKIENGKKSPALDQLEKIAIALGVKMTDLFDSKHK